MGNLTAIYFSPTGGNEVGVCAVARGDRQLRRAESDRPGNEGAGVRFPRTILWWSACPFTMDASHSCLTICCAACTETVRPPSLRRFTATANLTTRFWSFPAGAKAGISRRSGGGLRRPAYVFREDRSGRPDADDLLIAEEFGRSAKASMAEKDGKGLSCRGTGRTVRSRLRRLSPKEIKMHGLRACVRVCPAGAVAPETPRQTDAKKVYPLSCVRARLSRPCA